MSNDTYFQPGAVANGHYLASDNNWYPLPVQQPQVVVAPANNSGVTTALWVIIAILTVPVWIWFTPILVAAAIVWVASWFAVTVYKSVWKTYGWVGVAVTTIAIVAAAAASVAVVIV